MNKISEEHAQEVYTVSKSLFAKRNKIINYYLTQTNLFCSNNEIPPTPHELQSLILNRIATEHKRYSDDTTTLEQYIEKKPTDQEIEILKNKFGISMGLFSYSIQKRINSTIDLSLSFSFFASMIGVVDDYLDGDFNQKYGNTNPNTLASAFLNLSNIALQQEINKSNISPSEIKELLRRRYMACLKLTKAHTPDQTPDEVLYNKSVGDLLADVFMVSSPPNSEEKDKIRTAYRDIGIALQVLDDVIDYDDDKIKGIDKSFNYLILTNTPKTTAINKAQNLLRRAGNLLSPIIGSQPFGVYLFLPLSMVLPDVVLGATTSVEAIQSVFPPPYDVLITELFMDNGVPLPQIEVIHV